MKTHFISFVLGGILLTSGMTAFSQKDSSGIYQTVDDFINKKLSYAINYKTEKHKISDNLFLNDRQIKVKHYDSTYTLEKSSTYGYKDMKGKTYRFVDNKEYEILNPGESVLIYKYTEQTQHQPKLSPVPHDVFFFSSNASSVPVQLTKENVKEAYPENHKFHDAIDANFNADDQLISYDKFHHMYKINWLFQESMK